MIGAGSYLFLNFARQSRCIFSLAGFLQVGKCLFNVDCRRQRCQILDSSWKRKKKKKRKFGEKKAERRKEPGNADFGSGRFVRGPLGVVGEKTAAFGRTYGAGEQDEVDRSPRSHQHTHHWQHDPAGLTTPRAHVRVARSLRSHLQDPPGLPARGRPQWRRYDPPGAH